MCPRSAVNCQHHPRPCSFLTSRWPPSCLSIINTVQPYANLMPMPPFPGRAVHRVKDKLFGKSHQLVGRTELCHVSSEASTDIVTSVNFSVETVWKDHYIFFPEVNGLPVTGDEAQSRDGEASAEVSWSLQEEGVGTWVRSQALPVWFLSGRGTI